MKTTSSNVTSTPDLLLVVHHAGNHFRCLFVDQKNATMIDGVVIENEADLAALIQSRTPEQIVSILPGSTTICRTSLLPDTDEVQLQSALRLQAEAKLLGGLPSTAEHSLLSLALLENPAVLVSLSLGQKKPMRTFQKCFTMLLSFQQLVQSPRSSMDVDQNLQS